MPIDIQAKDGKPDDKRTSPIRSCMVIFYYQYSYQYTLISLLNISSQLKLPPKANCFDRKLLLNH